MATQGLLKMPRRILNLTLKKKWFDLIASGKKKTEFREIKNYWEKRLIHKKLDEVQFRNGYKTNSPFMRVEFKGLDIKEFRGKKHYEIKLGTVLEVKN